MESWQDTDITTGSGYIAMGANFSDVKFANIMLLKYTPPTITKTVGGAEANAAAGFGSSTAEAAEGAEAPEAEEAEEDDPSEENLDELAQEDKAEILDKKCLDADSMPTRKKWCEFDQGLESINVEICVINFCDMCCAL